MTVMGNTIARDCVCVCESRIQPDCANLCFLKQLFKEKCLHKRGLKRRMETRSPQEDTD